MECLPLPRWTENNKMKKYIFFFLLRHCHLTDDVFHNSNVKLLFKLVAVDLIWCDYVLCTIASKIWIIPKQERESAFPMSLVSTSCGLISEMTASKT